MEEVFISRDKQLVGGISKIKIYINDKFVGTLKNGEGKNFEVPISKNLKLRATYYWLSSEINFVNKTLSKCSFNTRFNMNNRVFVAFGLLINLLAILSVFVWNKYIMLVFYSVLTIFIYFLIFKKNSLILEKDLNN